MLTASIKSQLYDLLGKKVEYAGAIENGMLSLKKAASKNPSTTPLAKVTFHTHPRVSTMGDAVFYHSAVDMEFLPWAVHNKIVNPVNYLVTPNGIYRMSMRRTASDIIAKMSPAQLRSLEDILFVYFMYVSRLRKLHGQISIDAYLSYVNSFMFYSPSRMSKSLLSPGFIPIMKESIYQQPATPSFISEEARSEGRSLTPLMASKVMNLLWGCKLFRISFESW